MQQPKVSVATGTWNRFEMVSEAIEAALNQTYPIHEVVVYDDCSPDNSYERLKKKFAHDSRVKLFKQEKNTGGVPNWNAAINACEGEYIAWCSDDDRFFKDHIQKSMEYLLAHPEVDITHAEFASVFEDVSTRENFPVIDNSILDKVHTDPLRFGKPFLISASNIFEYYLKHFNWPFHPSTLVFKKSMWKEVGEFDPHYELADSDWYIRVAEKHTIAYLPYLGVLNRRHEDNWSSRMGTARMQFEFFNMVDKYLEYPTFSRSAAHKEQLKKSWKNFQYILLTRMYIAKQRRGYRNEASKLAQLIKSNFVENPIKYTLFKTIVFLMAPFNLIKLR